MASGLYRLGRWCFRHRALVLVAWLVVLVAVAVLATTFKQPTSNSFTIPGTQSQQALDLLNEKFPGTGGTQAQVVFSVPSPETLTDSSHRQAIETTLAQLRKDPQVVLVTDPFQAGTVSKDGRIAYATVAYPVPVGSVTTAARNALLDSGGPAKAAGIAVNFGGQVAQASTTSDTESIGILVAFIILLIGFGSVSASLLPLVAAIVGVAVTDLSLLALTALVSESSTTPILALMIGLAVGIDYSLFVMNRYRQFLIAEHEQRRGRGPSRRDLGVRCVLRGPDRADRLGCPRHRQHPLPHGDGTRCRWSRCRRRVRGDDPGARVAGLPRNAHRCAVGGPRRRSPRPRRPDSYRSRGATWVC